MEACNTHEIIAFWPFWEVCSFWGKATAATIMVVAFDVLVIWGVVKFSELFDSPMDIQTDNTTGR